jgi:hypothetical protein
LIVQVRQPDFDAVGDIVRNDATAACSPRGDDEFEYYAEIVSPAEPGEYQLRVYLPQATTLGEIKAKPIEAKLTVQSSE